jgi:hypothetical protein
MLANKMPLYSYGMTFIDFNQISKNPFVWLVDTFRDIIKVYYHEWSQFGVFKYIFIMIPICCGCTILYGDGLFSKKSNKFRIFDLILLLLLVATPFAGSPVTQGRLPTRAYVAIPFVESMLLVLAIATTPSKFVYRLVLSISILATIQIIDIQSVTQARSWAALQHDLLTAGTVYNKILEASDSTKNTLPIKVALFGGIGPSLPFPSAETGARGRSFFEWDGGNPVRMVSFMKMIGLTGIKEIDTTDLCRMIPLAAAMPSYPKAGFVRNANGIVIAKLSSDWGFVISNCKDLASNNLVVSTEKPQLGLNYAGHIEKMLSDSNSIYVDGWGLVGLSKDSTIHIATDYMVNSVTFKRTYRPDVANQLNDTNLLLSGFTIKLDISSSHPGDNYLCIWTEDGVYGKNLLPTSTCYFQ